MSADANGGISIVIIKGVFTADQSSQDYNLKGNF